MLETFISSLKDISHYNNLYCFDRLMNIMHCSDNIFYVALIPKIQQQIKCRFISLLNYKSLIISLIIITLGVLYKFYVNKRLLLKSETCLMLEQTALCIILY